ncbi:DUF5130 family protein [Nocardioides zeae]|uniref:DUF5130 family protein n=1 Tax=Nocardioides imazamoxiresistens TaxID=3231893 RepID=A0ABU3PSR7_9ACTN|nr:DUF5130 family protein [Nocardioides zeae]MDT9591897.1 DUF5130 family protein [Nocardioides zeae]
MAQVAGGDRFTTQDKRLIDGTIRSAEQLSRFEFSVYVGPTHGDPRAYATQLHNSLTVPAKSVLIMVDPEQKVLEIVTGGRVRAKVDDGQVLAAVGSMIESFRADDLVGGINHGVARIAELGANAKPALPVQAENQAENKAEHPTD